MDISDIVEDDVPEVDSEERMGTLRSRFQNGLPKGVVVTDDDGYVGIVEEKKLMNSHISDQTKADRLSGSAPRINSSHRIREAARMMIDGSSKVAPYFRGDEVVGVITQDSILETIKSKLHVLDVDDICTTDVVTVGSDSTVGQVISVIRKNGISRVPVEDDGELEGIITTEDIVSVSVRSEESMTDGDRGGNRDDMLDLPIDNIVSTPVATIHKSKTVEDAVDIMLKNGYGGLVVESDDDNIYGIITKTDAIRSLTFEEGNELPIQITNVNLMNSLNRESIENELLSIADKYSEMTVHHAHVRFHIESNNTHRGERLVQCTIRLQTNKNQVAGSGEGYGSRQSFNVACDKLERNVLDLKGINNPKRSGNLEDLSDI